MHVVLIILARCLVKLSVLPYLYCFLQLARSFRNTAAILEAEAQFEVEVGFSSTAPQIPADTSATGPLQSGAAGSQDEPCE